MQFIFLLIVILRSIMGITRTDIFSDEQNQLSVMLKAIAHPARIAILQHIIKANACICGHLVDELGLAQATISQHLKELKNAGLIKGAIEGTAICYCIDEKAIEVLQGYFGAIAAQLTCRNNDCC